MCTGPRELEGEDCIGRDGGPVPKRKGWLPMVETGQEFTCAGKRYRVKEVYKDPDTGVVVADVTPCGPPGWLFMVPVEWIEALQRADNEGPGFEPRRMFDESRIQDAAEIISNLAQVNSTVSSVYNAARAADINPHGDTAMREYLIQLYLECCSCRRQLQKTLESTPIVFPMGKTPVPPEGE